MSFDIKQRLTGAQLAGGNPSAGYRTENDFYATDPQAVNDLFNALSKYDPDFNDFSPRTFLEPCVGNGNIAKATTDYFLFSLKRNENSQCTFIDLVDRGYPNTKVQDFLLFESMQPQTKFDLIVSNPPVFSRLGVRAEILTAPVRPRLPCVLSKNPILGRRKTQTVPVGQPACVLFSVCQAYAHLEQRTTHGRTRQAMGNYYVPRLVRMETGQSRPVQDSPHLDN